MSRTGVKVGDKQALAIGTPQTLAALRNIGKAMLLDFEMLGITSIKELAAQNADELYLRLGTLTGHRHDPCVHDTFAAGQRACCLSDFLSYEGVG